MKATFGEGAGPLAALSAQVLGWRPHEFWQATPAELELALGSTQDEAEAPSRTLIEELIERDRDGR